MTPGNSSHPSEPNRHAAGSGRRKVIFAAAAAVLLGTCSMSSVRAQSYAPVVITPPVVDAVDENNVSMLTGKVHYSVPAVALGDVSFAPFTTNQQFDASSVNDSNYGYVQICASPSAPDSYTIITDCVSTQASLYAIYGEQRAAFQYYNGQYTPANFDGSSFSDNGTTCTWTQRDGTQIVYVAFHTSSNAPCQSNNISKIVHPDGRTETYYYYGSSSTPTTSWKPSPIISIATNSGYLLKYNYSGTPTWGAETSVVAINRAFETCDPTALTCTTVNSWPMATLSWVSFKVTSDDLLAAPDPTLHYTFTLTDQAHRQHVFTLDSIFRVIAYQPPEATGPLVSYTLCSLHRNGSTLSNCWGTTTWVPTPYNVFDPIPPLFDLVYSATRNGQPLPYQYYAAFTANSPPGWSTWAHSVTNPQGLTMSAAGNATPGMEYYYGPTDSIVHYDQTTDSFERNVQNYLTQTVTPRGVQKHYGWDLRGNLGEIYKNPVGSTQTSMLVQNATYPGPCTNLATCTSSCTNIVTCNKPSSVTDGNGNTSSFSYDPVHGGVLTVTGPAVNVTNPASPPVQPQTRYTYIQRNAWYLSSSGAMTKDTNPIWVLATESYCRETAAATSRVGCSGPDEVFTSYAYGPDTGPNNLLMRGKAVTADGQTLMTCYLHDKRGNKMSQISPNAARASCPDY